jgi:hypothetical protein
MSECSCDCAEGEIVITALSTYRDKRVGISHEMSSSTPRTLNVPQHSTGLYRAS